MKKILTKDIVKTELKKIYLHDVIKYGALLLLCVAYLLLYFFKPQLSIYNPKGFFWMLSPLYVYIIAISVVFLYETLKSYHLTKNNKINIVADVLIDKSQKTQLSRYRGCHHTYTFLFEKSGEYKTKKHILAFSNPYNMDHKQLYDISQVGDEFYVVSVGKHKNMLAYNKNFFELKEV